jgi:hypothetical protein
MHVTVTCQSIPSAELFRWANAGRRPPEEATIQRTLTCADMNPNDGSTPITQVPAPQLDRYSPEQRGLNRSEAELTAVSRLLRLREPHALKELGSKRDPAPPGPTTIRVCWTTNNEPALAPRPISAATDWARVVPGKAIWHGEGIDEPDAGRRKLCGGPRSTRRTGRGGLTPKSRFPAVEARRHVDR